jgi:hypothetical protein
LKSTKLLQPFYGKGCAKPPEHSETVIENACLLTAPQQRKRPLTLFMGGSG